MVTRSLTVERLREVLAYDPATGYFTWKLSRGRVKAGAAAGTADGQGYIAIGIDGRFYRAHVLAWLHVHGVWPSLKIDHKDTIRCHNWIDNLREATTSINGQNRSGADRDSVTGVLGVSPSRGKFKASIRVDGKTHMLGRFNDPSAAEAAYLSAKARLHEGYQPSNP